MEEIKPIAMPGTHQKFLEFFNTKEYKKDIKILDLGAGHGAFTKKLYDKGFDVSAGDLFPELFHFDSIECKKIDITKTFPYEDNTYDLVIAIEVSEHIIDHENFFKEISRVLKPTGTLYLSTPNILSLKSRVRFLYTGFYYSFNKLEINNHDGLQHVASLTLDQYNYAAIKHNFKPAEFEIDRQQTTSKLLFLLMFPLIFLYPKIKKISTFHNHKKLLLGRLLFLGFENNKS